MAASRTDPIIRHLRAVVLRRDGAGRTDGQLLEDFVAARDAAAFEALVRRHGPMVLGVCRRVLGDAHDAEDAFQATFLVLARKASSVWPRQMVGNWLYGVAHTTAVRARAAKARRRQRERQVPNMPEPKAVPRDAWDDLQPLLDEELARLPDKYRLAVVLCDLEGRTRREVAAQFRIPEGTLSSRLTTGRRMLARRLTRRGVTLSGGSVAAVLSRNAVSANVPAAVVSATVRAVEVVAAGQAAMSGAVSAEVAALTEGVLKTMLLNKLKTVTAVLLVLGVVAFGGGLFSGHTPAAAEEQPQTKAAPEQPQTEAAPEEPFRVDAVPGTQFQRYVASFRDTGTVRDPVTDYNALFDRAQKVLRDYFEIEYANRFEGRIEACPPKAQLRADGVPRRRATVQITPAADGTFSVQVRVLNYRPIGPQTPAESIDRDAELEKLILKRLDLQPVRADRGREKAPPTPAVDEKRVRQYHVECSLVKADPGSMPVPIGRDRGRDERGKVLAQPNMLILEGQEGRFHTGGQTPTASDRDGPVDFIEVGMSVRVKVVNLGEGWMRVEAAFERIDEKGTVEENGTQYSGKVVRCVGRVRLGEGLKLVERDASGQAQYWARIRVVKEETTVTQTREAEREPQESR
jgi:RNA polymerase sigma factor (sigma-70 family)